MKLIFKTFKAILPLRNCPFCGSLDVNLRELDFYETNSIGGSDSATYAVVCETCDAQGPSIPVSIVYKNGNQVPISQKTLLQANKNWNRRGGETKL